MTTWSADDDRPGRYINSDNMSAPFEATIDPLALVGLGGPSDARLRRSFHAFRYRRVLARKQDQFAHCLLRLDRVFFGDRLENLQMIGELIAALNPFVSEMIKGLLVASSSVA